MTASEHRARARAALKGKWIWAVLITLLASILGGIAGSGNININTDANVNFNTNIDISQELSSAGIPMDQLEQEVTQVLEGMDFGQLFSGFFTEVPSFVWWIVGIVTVISIAVSLAFSLFIGGPVQLGYRKYTLNLMDGAPAEIGDAFSEFSRMGRAAKYRLLDWLIGFVPMLIWGVISFVLVLLFQNWGAFFVVVTMFVLFGFEIYLFYGIILSDFILADNPECTPADAMRRSWALMNGRRWDYFFLGLSFIGWGILAAFTFGIGGLFLNPYQQVSFASFYRELVPAPAAPVQEPEPPQDYDYKLIPESDPSV